MQSALKKKASDQTVEKSAAMKDFALHLPADLFAEVEDYRWRKRLPSNTEAIRQLLRSGLDADK